ncbi:MAG: hypothetical protein Fur0010_28430 [Bdellovibrio sp.]
MKLYLIILVYLFTSSLIAAEVDSFTVRYLPIENSVKIINQKTNELLKAALDELNQKNHGCSEKKLYKRLRKDFNNQYRGTFSKWVVTTDEFDKKLVGIRDSIYSEWTWKEAIVLGGWSRIIDPSAATLNINGHYIGTDKFEHFLGSGFLYFKEYYLKGNKVIEAMKIGLKAETGYMGAVTTGVQSFGDLTANFNGMRFWNHMLQKREDILGKEYNIGPYVSCVDNKWVQVKEIDWSNYIDAAFDETVNCSKFKTASMVDKVLTKLKALEDIDGKNYFCPMFTDAQEELRTKYGRFAPQLLNFEGFEKANKDWQSFFDLILH